MVAIVDALELAENLRTPTFLLFACFWTLDGPATKRLSSSRRRSSPRRHSGEWLWSKSRPASRFLCRRTSSCSNRL
jgi:hypothetical protein